MQPQEFIIYGNDEQQFIEHLENNAAYIRKELNDRMKQRNTYSLQMILIVGGLIFGLLLPYENIKNYTNISFDMVISFILILCPIPMIYFTRQIMHSYDVSETMGKYMREVLEPMFVTLHYNFLESTYGKLTELKTPYERISIPAIKNFKMDRISEVEWEKFRQDKLQSGIRKEFFLTSMLFVFAFDFFISIVMLVFFHSPIYWLPIIFGFMYLRLIDGLFQDYFPGLLTDKSDVNRLFNLKSGATMGSLSGLFVILPFMGNHILDSLISNIGSIGIIFILSTLTGILVEKGVRAILKEAHPSVRNYPIIISKTQDHYSAFCPDLPDCRATGRTKDEVMYNIKEMIKFHFQVSKPNNAEVQVPSAELRYVEISL
jgi:predicted RNase H-like HicB family nuclease